MIKCSLFDVGWKKPIKQYFQFSLGYSVSFKFWRYTRPTGLGHLAESGQNLMHLYYFLFSTVSSFRIQIRSQTEVG